VPAAEGAGHHVSRRSRRLLVLAVLLGLLAFVVLTALVATHAGGGLDGRTLSWMEAHQRRPFTAAAVLLHYLGLWPLLAAVVAALAGLLWRRGRRAQARYLGLAAALSLALNLLLKAVFSRQPPGAGTVVHASEYAFPSGHTMAATTLATAVTLIAWRTRWRWPVLLLAAAFALAMGLSRAYLGVHWPSDVAAGWAMGAVVALAVRAAVQRPAPAAPIEVVFLDWGGTLMVDDGKQAGPMKDWPAVAAVEGAQEALRRLRPHYRLLVATNADDSHAPEVRAALARACLDELVDGVVSSLDVGARKPTAGYYRAALRRAGRGGAPLDPRRAVMVGDSWANDVAGAMAAGLRAVWLNASLAPVPPGAPAPDAVISRMAELPDTLARLGGQPGLRPGPRRS